MVEPEKQYTQIFIQINIRAILQYQNKKQDNLLHMRVKADVDGMRISP